MIKNKILDLLMPVLPKNDLSHWVGRLVHKKIPGPLGRKMVRGFAKAYNLNMDEAEHPIEKYESVGALFTRKLKVGVRPIQAGIVAGSGIARNAAWFVCLAHAAGFQCRPGLFSQC